MARYASGTRTGAGSTTLPILSIYAAAAVNFRLREVGCFNTTATAVAIKLVRLASAGTQGAGLVEAKLDSSSVAASCTVFTTHTGAPTLGDDLGYRFTCGAAIGAGVIWTFGGDVGINCDVGTGNGVGIIVATGTGQVCDAYMIWDE
jgi:hypothetical protein